MKTMAVSFGDGHLDVGAKFAVERFAELNDVEAMVMDAEKIPNNLNAAAYMKAWIFDAVPSDVERVVWIDADLIPIRSIIDVMPDYPIPFSAVTDAPKSRQIAEWDVPEVEEIRVYFNSGFFIAHREAEPVFEEWKKMAVDGVDRVYWDQTPMNLLVDKMLSPGDVFELPPTFNWLSSFGYMPEEVRMYHMAGWDKNEKVEVMKILEAITGKSTARESHIERGASCAAVW